MRSFGLIELQQIVDLAGQELEREDRYVAGCFARNAVNPLNDHKLVPGIICLKNEGYYQRVTARALLASFPFLVKLEETYPGGRCDLALYGGDPAECIAVGEMKLAMKAGFEEDAKSIRGDMIKLAKAACGQFLILFSMCPKGTTYQFVADLKNHLQVSGRLSCQHVFSTKFWPGGNDPVSEGDFAVIGILLKQVEVAA